MHNRRALTLIFIANSISGFAQGISIIAIPWYFAVQIEQPVLYGILYGLITVLGMFWGLYAGDLVDKYNRKRILQFINLTGGIFLLSVSLFGIYYGHVPMFMVASVFMFTSFIYVIHYPNLYAFLQEISERHNYGKVTSYIEIQGQLTSMVAGGLAAILLAGYSNSDFLGIAGFSVNIPKWDLHQIFLMDAVTYFIALLFISMIRFAPIAERAFDTGDVWERLSNGYKYLLQRPLLFIFGSSSYAVFMVVLVVAFFLWPLYIANHLQRDADVYGIMQICFAAGAVFAGVLIRWLFRKTTIIMAIILMLIITSFVSLFYAITSAIILCFVASFFLGLCNAGTRIMRITYLFQHIPNNVIGRTASIFNVVSVLIRFSLILLFSLPFFAKGNNVVYCFGALSVFVLVAGIPLIYFYKHLISDKAGDMRSFRSLMSEKS